MPPAHLTRLLALWLRQLGRLGADPDRQRSVALVLNSGIGTPIGDLRMLQVGGVALPCATRSDKQR